MYPSIFGTASPKFRDLDTDEIINFRCQILKDEQDYKEIQHQSIINLHREWNDLAEHWIYECEVLLLKYPEADRQDLYLLLDSYENKVVEFWRRNDSDPTGMFRVDEVTPYYMDHPDYPDKVFMRFISTEGFPSTSNEVNIAAIDNLAIYPDNTGTFRITRTGSFIGNLTVNFTISGTATAGVDYVDNLGTSKVIPDGDSYVDIIVTPLESEVGAGKTVIATLAAGSYNIGSFDTATINIVEAVPPTIADLYLWFPDFNLEPDGDGFTWLDEVNKIITLDGDYGTGDGIVQYPESFNNKKLLHCWNPATATFSDDIFDGYENITLGCILQGILPAPPFTHNNLGFKVHNIRNDIAAHSFYFSEISSGSDPDYVAHGFQFTLTFPTYGSVNVIIGTDISVPFEPMIIFVRIKLTRTQSIEVIVNGQVLPKEDFDRGTDINGFWNSTKYLGDGAAEVGWKGLMGEFFYYSRLLTDAEINQLGNYFAEKYALTWDDI